MSYNINSLFTPYKILPKETKIPIFLLKKAIIYIIMA